MAAAEPLTFPLEAGEFRIRSKPIFLLTYKDQSEVIVFDADMTVRTGAPEEKRRGKRQVAVDVTEWVATGRSQLLDQELSLRLEGDQPRSHVTARKFDQDFPANLRFRMKWAVDVAGERIDGLDSQAVGTINSFPPRINDRFEIVGKDIRVGEVTLESLACAC